MAFQRVFVLLGKTQILYKSFYKQKCKHNKIWDQTRHDYVDITAETKHCIRKKVKSHIQGVLYNRLPFSAL